MMIVASCLISTASASNKNNSSHTFLNSNHGNGNNYRVNRNSYNRAVEDIVDEASEYRSSDAATVSDVRIVKLKRVGNSALGFSIRGGYEHGTGVFVSEVSPDSEAEREGLQVGDQILRVNGFSIEQAIHEEVIALIKSTPRVTLKVKSVGLIPIKETQTKSISWKYVESQPVCPIHNRWPSKTAVVATSTPPSSASSHSSTSETELFQNFSLAGNDFMEAKVFISLGAGQGLGCSVVKGPGGYPGIFVQVVKKGGVAEESGLEVGDQIIGMNGTSLEPSDIEFNEAIAMIKSCQQMTLTVRKKSGLNLFRSHKQKIKALVHSNPSDEFASSNLHLPLSSKQSTSSSGSSDNPRYFDASEHDFSISEVESSGNDQIVKIPRIHQGNWKLSKPDMQPSAAETNCGDDSKPVSTKMMYEEVRKEEERLCEERKKLEAEQKRLQSELEKLEKERKQLENLKQEECKSISSASTASGSQSVSSVGSGSVSSSQTNFLDEIKKLAERRNGEDALITDTLNKTRHADNNAAVKSKHFGPDGDKRKRHELLMEEFRAAHTKMFGSQPKQEAVATQSTISKTTSNLIPCPPPLPNDVKKPPVSHSKSVPPLPTFVNDSGEKVTILRTTASPKKPPPPPVPAKKSSSPPILTISSYESNQAPNRFLVNESCSNNRSVITVGDSSQRNDVSVVTSESRLSESSTSKSPISIKINVPIVNTVNK